jgi:hypothetical protein
VSCRYLVGLAGGIALLPLVVLMVEVDALSVRRVNWWCSCARAGRCG